MPAGTIVFDRMTHVPPGTGPGYYPADTWATRTQSRTLTYTQAGQLAADYGDTITRTTYQAVAVNYRDKTWWRIANSNRNPNVAGPVRPVPSQFTCGKNGPQLLYTASPGQMVAWLRAEVSCGQLTADGTGTADGVNAVKLTGTGDHSATTYWVNPTTYLPVRVTVTMGPGIPALQDDLQWLPPTAANLAKLNPPVPPSGFTPVPPGCITGCSR